MLLESFIPQLPTTLLDTIIIVVAALGVLVMIYSQFVEAENRRDLIRMVGAGALLVYALTIQNLIFTLAMGGVFLAALIEFVEIYLGIHTHDTRQIETYRKIGK